MRQQDVSVVVPAYQSSRTIARAVDSLLCQTRPPGEILVVNDGSTDDLLDTLEPYGGQIRLIAKPNGGAASARNLGIESVKGEIVAFLDADDFWEPGKLEHQLAILEAHPEV